MATDPRFTASTISQVHGVASALCVMIAGRDARFGTLAACSTRRRAFSESDVSFVQAVANVVANAVERQRVQARLHAVREIERRRIARDLNDEALQDLTHALALARRFEPDNGLVSALTRVGEQLRAAVPAGTTVRVEVPLPADLDEVVDAVRQLGARG